MNIISETKENILDVFLDLVSTLGYENVSIRDITKKISITSASLYNHFESKRNLLEYTYDYYLKYQFENRKPINMMKEIIEKEEAERIIRAFVYRFETKDRKKYIRMILITKIIHMRIYQDSTANAIFVERNKSNTEYVIDILRYGVDIGRIDRSFDIETFADILIGSMIMMGIKAYTYPGYKEDQLEQEKRIIVIFSQILSSVIKWR